MFITLEGIHGAGKSVLSGSLREIFTRNRIPVMIARDQIGTELSARIREINVMLSAEVDPLVEAFLVAAARRQTFVEIIKPALEKNAHVIGERFSDAFFAFGDARGQSHDFLRVLETYTSGGLQPDLTILLDLEPEMALGRIPENERHRVERSEMDFHHRLRNAYLKRAQDHANRFAIIDGGLNAKEVLQLALKAIDRVQSGLLIYECN